MVLAFEVFTMHYNLLPEKRIMWTPIIFGSIGGFLVLLVSIFFNRLSYYLFFILMGTSLMVGFLGLYLHNRWRFPVFLDFLFHNKPFEFEILTTYTPVLAPSAFIAIGSLGMLIAVFEGWGK